MIDLTGVRKTWKGALALDVPSLAFATRETTALVGPSGCGKSTLLRIVAGLIAPDAGAVRIDGRELTPATVEEARRGIGYVIQDGGLFPHLTAEGNAALLARWLRRPEPEVRARLDALCDLVRLPRAMLARYPRELSGGQRQRVSLVRALMLDPPRLLLDEPFAALDPITRRELQEELRAIFDRLSKTVILVTHDLGEAAFLARDLVLMREGRVVQKGTLRDLRERPAEPWVTSFVHAQRALPPREVA